MDATPVVLVWDRGTLEAECERASIIKDGVETYLSRAIFADSAERSVRVQLSRVEEHGRRRVIARVTQQDDEGRSSGERRVDGDESCASLDEQLVLVVALLVDTPDTAAPSADPEPTPAPEPPLPPATPEPAAQSAEIVTVPSLERAASSPAHFVLLGFGAVNAGATPGPAVGAGLAFSYKPRGFWGLGLEVTRLGPTRERLESGSLEVSLWQMSANLCPLQGSDERAWWSACASVGAGRLHVHSRGLLEARDKNQWFALPGIGVRGAGIVGRHWLLGGGVLAAVPISPERYVYRDQQGRTQSAFQLSSLVLTAHLGVGWILN